MRTGFLVIVLVLAACEDQGAPDGEDRPGSDASEPLPLLVEQEARFDTTLIQGGVTYRVSTHSFVAPESTFVEQQSTTFDGRSAPLRFFDQVIDFRVERAGRPLYEQRLRKETFLPVIEDEDPAYLDAFRQQATLWRADFHSINDTTGTVFLEVFVTVPDTDVTELFNLRIDTSGTAYIERVVVPWGDPYD